MRTEPFDPSGVLTITTDFGHKGPFVGTMKGQILGRLPEAQIVDLTHDILVHWPAEAGFWIARSYGYFPTGTVHVAVVDPGVGTQREIIAVHAGGHVFIGPDNGLLAPVIERQTSAIVYRLQASVLRHIGVSKISATFHGRDIFAPLAAEIAAGRLAPDAIGPRADEWVPSWVEPATRNHDEIHGVVITIDHFGNLISNIERRLIASLQQPKVQIGGHTIDIHRTYGDVKPGQHLALINAFDVLEIACAEGSATETLGVGRGGAIVVTDSTR